MVFYFSKKIYNKESLIKAAYNFTDKAYIHLDSDALNYIVNIEMKTDHVDISEKEFQNEIIAQMVRLNVQKRTKNVRELLLARALASTVIEKDHIEEEKFPEENIDDILIDWFEQNE